MTINELFINLLQFKSITPNDDGAMKFIKEYLNEYEVVEINKNGVKNLFLYKKFSEGEHLCFAGHIDVVPPGNGWDTDPFTPTIKEDRIYARGAQDMKSGVAAFLYALKHTKNFNGTLSTIITSDEEGDAKFGTIEVLKYLKEKNFLPDFSIVAEPTCEKEFGDAIKIGRRGSINGVIKVFGKQGHAAYPEKSINPIHQIAKVLDKVAGVDLDNGDEYFAPSKFVITDIRAGMEVTNVTPGELKMMFNVRNNTHTSKEDIKNFISKYFKDIKYTLDLNQSAKPFVTKPDSKIVTLLDEAIKKETNIKPKYSTAGGTSDARFLAEFGIKAVEFGVINDSIHAPNENTKLKYVVQLSNIFQNIINKF
jgi:succinyl-diaminopimelate desuccinylase